MWVRYVKIKCRVNNIIRKRCMKIKAALRAVRATNNILFNSSLYTSYARVHIDNLNVLRVHATTILFSSIALERNKIACECMRSGGQIFQFFFQPL